MDAEKNNARFRQLSTYNPQLPVLSSIQEHPSSKTSDKPTIKYTVADVDSEIGVFGAEKYLSMKPDHDNSTVDIINQKEKENIQDHPHPQMTKTTSTRSRASRHRTPSVRSESTYNSQTFPMRINNVQDNKQRKTNETSVSFGGFRCYGPCSGVKTVNTERSKSGNGRNYDRDFIAYDARKHINKPRLRLEARKADYPEPQRSDIAVNLERKLSMLTWNAIPNHLSTKNNNGNKSLMSSKTQEDETSSDASSDLFEIENITSSAYEPSEASIGWSVVTGSMADQSVISDFDMVKRGTRSGSVVETKPVIAEKVRSGGFLSGCKSHKAVLVVDSTRNSKEAAMVDHHEMSQKKKFKTEIRIQDLSFL
ncbi:Protein PHYTOCHROME KINASE SUBSTRATE 3 [Hirschfeldia incana]|nr:Protein PHYTOCHROME KINASE SUBSTRATE 3 [Hirschfeldia incana]